ncbi:NAD(P)-dependent oxidoreductase [Candidatus Pelagibacter sp.]|jgi:nucleoside-diphosphate-sugar epimerase|nr:NAD(P)-dependent oxidoreductase [Candidatus Pelagibacter sp.]
MKKKKILILGSEGQIGGHLVDYLKIKKRFEIIKFDLVLGKKFDLRNFNNKLLKKYIQQSDFVFFLAFDVGGSRYLKKYQRSYDFLINNILIMGNVFKLLKDSRKKFLFASSQMSNMDFSPYGTLKRLGEDITKSINGVYVKFWNVYGIEKQLDKSHVITDFILMALEKKKIDMLTNGKETREFLYADDCSAGLFKIMNKFDYFKKIKKELHLTTTKKTKVIDIAKIVKKILKKKNIDIRINRAIFKDDVQKNKSNEANKFLFNFWKPKYTIESGIEKTLKYYMKFR